MERPTIRPIDTFDEIEQCVELQRSVWSMPDVDLTPARLFVIAKWSTAPPLGAFDERGSVVGFVHTLLARFEGTICYYSHMLAVDERLRDTGIGYRLKLAQRDQAIADNVPLVVWTFDPLQSRNAHFNLNKLGAVARRYITNFYGERHATVFDAGIGSDRVYAEWWVRSRNVERALAGEPRADAGPRVYVEVPSDISGLKRRDQESALIWRLRTRERFQSSLSRGMVAIGFERGGEQATSRYIFADEEAVRDALR